MQRRICNVLAGINILGVKVVADAQAANPVPGDPLTGSGVVSRSANTLTLTIEHRAAASPPTPTLELQTQGEALALQLSQTLADSTPAHASVDERIDAALIDAGRPLPVGELRTLCRVRNATLHQRLAALTRAGHLVRSPEGYRLAITP